MMRCGPGELTIAAALKPPACYTRTPTHTHKKMRNVRSSLARHTSFFLWKVSCSTLWLIYFGSTCALGSFLPEKRNTHAEGYMRCELLLKSAAASYLTDFFISFLRSRPVRHLFVWMGITCCRFWELRHRIGFLTLGCLFHGVLIFLKIWYGTLILNPKKYIVMPNQ